MASSYDVWLQGELLKEFERSGFALVKKHEPTDTGKSAAARLGRDPGNDPRPRNEEE